MNETNRWTVNFQFFINGTIALHVSGQFFCPSSGGLSAVQRLWYNFMQLGDRLLSGTGWNCSSFEFTVRRPGYPSVWTISQISLSIYRLKALSKSKRKKWGCQSFSGIFSMICLNTQVQSAPKHWVLFSQQQHFADWCQYSIQILAPALSAIIITLFGPQQWDSRPSPSQSFTRRLQTALNLPHCTFSVVQQNFATRDHEYLSYPLSQLIQCPSGKD